MYAVIETGGKQYRVELGTELAVELLDAQPGQEITLDRVLLVADGDDAAVGRPLVSDASVRAEVLRQDRGDKVISFKYRPKARRRVKKGHRQEQTVLRVTDLRHNGKSAAESARDAEAAAKTERQRLEEAAARQAAEDAALAAKLASRTSSPTASTSPPSDTETSAARPPRRSRGKAPAAAVEPVEEAPAVDAGADDASADEAPESVESTASDTETDTPAEPEQHLSEESSPLPDETEASDGPGTPARRRPRRKDE